MSEWLIFLKCTFPCTLLLKDPSISFPQRPGPAASAEPVPCRTPSASSTPDPPTSPLPILPCLHFPAFALAFSVPRRSLACFTSAPLLSLSSAQAGPAPKACGGLPPPAPASHSSHTDLEESALLWVLQGVCFGTELCPFSSW